MTETSPDALPLIDLTLLDLDAQELTDQAITDAASKLPEWVPREGHTEVVLLESQALITSELVYAVNRLPPAVLEALLALYGLDRDPGTPPAASVTFTTSAATDVLIPAGTRVRVIYDNGDASVDFLTDVDHTIAAGAGTGTVAATGEENTDAVNGLTTGAEVELVDSLIAIDTTNLATPITGGVDPEDSAAYRARGANLFRRLVSTLVLPEHFTAAALEEPAVTRATTLDLYNPDLGAGTPGDHPGHVTVAASAGGGTALDPAVATALVASLEAKAHAALEVHVIAPTVTPVDVTATVTVLPGSLAADVEAAVATAVADYLDPDAWDYGGTVYRNELIALIDGVAGVGRVVTLDAPAADVVLAGVAPLADAGVVTITTQA